MNGLHDPELARSLHQERAARLAAEFRAGGARTAPSAVTALHSRLRGRLAGLTGALRRSTARLPRA